MALQRFQILLEPGQIAAMRAIEEKNGARVATQVRLAVTTYLRKQTILKPREIEKLWKSKSATK